MYVVWKEKVRSIVGSALDCSAFSALDCEVCARLHITTPISHGIAENALT